MEEKEIILRLNSGNEVDIKSTVNWLQEKFYTVWLGCIKRDWDIDLSWNAFDYAIITFVRHVQTAEYEAGNWIGFCRTTATTRYWQLFKRQKSFSSLDDVLPTPIEMDDTEAFYGLLHLFNEIPWEKEGYHIKTIAEWHIDGLSWKDIVIELQKTGIEDVNESALRQEFSRAISDVRTVLIRQNWSYLNKVVQFCHSFCSFFVKLKLDGMRNNQIRQDHPEMADKIIEQTHKGNFVDAANTQMNTCTKCLVKKIVH
jgi:hypothetical protein